MNMLQLYRTAEPRETDSQENDVLVHLESEVDGPQFVDMATIRRRVAMIKNRWTPDTVRARAIEGARRRVELEGLVSNLLAYDEDEHFGDEHDFRVVI